MLETDSFETTMDEQRIRELEARVKWLEGALTSVLQSRRSGAPENGEATLLAVTNRMAAAHVERLPQPTQRLLAVTPPAPLTRKPAATVEAMRFTNAFSTLDERLREQEALESATRRQPHLAPPILIDEALIDKAFARPIPEKIEVTAAIEESYPHLLERIVATWRSPESAMYLRKLIVDERGGRQGFPFEVMSELLMLSAVIEAPETAQW
jgi:hypothetical protein